MFVAAGAGSWIKIPETLIIILRSIVNPAPPSLFFINEEGQFKVNSHCYLKGKTKISH